MSSIDWGDAPTWIAAVFAGGAALFAGLTIRSQRQQIAEQRGFIGEQSRNLRLEREALEAGRQERRRAQAEEIYIGRTNRRALGEVRNHSGAPIKDVTLEAGDLRSVSAEFVDLEGRPTSRTTNELPLAVVGAGKRATFLLRLEQPLSEVSETFVVTFTDADGVRWQRNEHGLLTELADER
ncbi:MULTISPECIES: hypothetical protein [unclassified Streptomyces]|uniref:hypothetical protein n=1 Tax=unclassified Streptomyces TaxID=2593676 RepID=UPI00081E232A|nr:MULTISPECIES: hypothetical protein [unclassified Streptomyces]MYR93086.1 hypothetical protein [Streptomyces sp. SID4937]SCD46204.1 hypothetical protein GA0115243_102166 [Streptomyces sp. ScaeMP-e83]